MCGIVGIINIAGETLPNTVKPVMKRMTDAMLWRGPDEEGIWQKGAACFGHRRLSIIDLADGQQPMSYLNGKYIMVFNGEIYNFRELRVELEKMGAVFNTSSDTEVLVAAYAFMGIECLQAIEGMFAFAIWDAEKKRLFCGRDHFGKKPFYYTIQHGYFVFASELQSIALLKNSGSLPDFSFTLSPSSLTRYLAYEYVPVPETIYGEVKSLEPSHYLLLENGRVSVSRYWDMPVPAKELPASEEEVCGEIRNLMTRATRLRMISDVPLGVFLSGGIDSSIVAGLMAHNSEKAIETFSIGFSEASYDESRYANIAAKAYGAHHHEKILSAEDCARQLPDIVRKMDTPMADASCAPTWLLSGLAKEHVTVALGGDGADEFWAGYEHYIGYRLAVVYNRLPAWLRKSVISKLAALLPESAGYINPALAVKTFLAGAAAPDWLRVQTMLTALDGSAQKNILSRDWLNSANSSLLEEDVLYAPTKRHFEHWQNAMANSFERAFHVYVRQFMLDDILVKVDRCSMLHSLEVRAPFLDKKVTEYVASLPVDCKLHGFKRKYLLKKAFANLLPPQILKRNKRGFQIPVAEWLRTSLKPLLLDLLSESTLRRQQIFNSSAIKMMMEEHFSRKKDYRKQLWTLLVFQLWADANREWIKL